MEQTRNGLKLTKIALAFATAYALSASATTVYTESNDAGGNTIQVIHSAHNGTLQLVGNIPTGGLGTGAGLGNQGALALSHRGHRLYAVNAGSNDISAFVVSRRGLKLIDKIASGGERPISLTVYRNRLYVLNAGAEGSITGFRILRDGHLKAIDGARKTIDSSTAPAEIAFADDGEKLVVTEKASNQIVTFAVTDDGAIGDPVVTASSGRTPFGFTIDRRGTLLVSEAFGGEAHASALSSYDIGEARTGVPLETISASIPTHQTAACWVTLARHGRYAYTMNTGSGSVTGFRVLRSGSVRLLAADGVSGIAGGGPTDGTTDRDGDTLFVLSPPIGEIVSFKIGFDGSLQKLGEVQGISLTATGLVAR